MVEIGVGEYSSLSLEPIGFVRTAMTSKIETARQPASARGTQGKIELLPDRNLAHALEDLAGWEFIWVVFWFHLNTSWRPKVLPPRSTTGKKGVFATRSPHRPNPIGLSAVRLERIEGLSIFIGDVDMVDGTPVLDIKPYVPYTDAHPDARSGWLDDTGRALRGDAPADPVDAYDVTFDPLAAEQAAWIEARTGFDLRERIAATLALGPEPHPYRRIRQVGGTFRLAVKDWRVRFQRAGRDLRVLEIGSGYRPAQIAAADAGDESLSAHRAFVTAWGPSVPE